MTDEAECVAGTRRAYLLACGSIAGVAGCNSLDSVSVGGDQQDGHPFADRTVAVQIDDVHEDFGRVESLLLDALSFWNDHVETYLTYSTTLEYRPDGGDPDIVVSEVAGIDECGLHDDDGIAGCADLIEDGHHDQLPASVRVIPQDPGEDWRYQRIIEHEIGHTLGLTHEEDPDFVMHESWKRRYPEYDRRERIVTLVDDRIEAYEAGEQSLANGFEAADAESFGVATEQYRDAGDHFRTALETIQTSRDVARELSPFDPADLDALESLLGTEETYIETVLDAVELLVEGSELLAADDQDGVEIYNDGVERHNEAVGSDLPEKAEYISAVGFSG